MAVPSCIEALQDEDIRVKREAAVAISKIGDISAIPALVKAVQDNDVDMRKNAVSALGNIGDRTVLDILTNISKNDENSEVRKRAKESIQKIDLLYSINP